MPLVLVTWPVGAAVEECFAAGLDEAEPSVADSERLKQFTLVIILRYVCCQMDTTYILPSAVAEPHTSAPVD